MVDKIILLLFTLLLERFLVENYSLLQLDLKLTSNSRIEIVSSHFSFQLRFNFSFFALFTDLFTEFEMSLKFPSSSMYTKQALLKYANVQRLGNW